MFNNVFQIEKCSDWWSGLVSLTDTGDKTWSAVPPRNSNVFKITLMASPLKTNHQLNARTITKWYWYENYDSSVSPSVAQTFFLVRCDRTVDSLKMLLVLLNTFELESVLARHQKIICGQQKYYSKKGLPRSFYQSTTRFKALCVSYLIQ